MSTPIQKTQELALATFLDVWTSGTLCYDIGPHLTCEECEALVLLLIANGKTGSAECLRESHCLEDDDYDMPEHVALRRELNKEGLEDE